MHARIEYCRKYNAAHKDKIAAYQRHYRENNKAAQKQLNRAYYLRNKDKISDSVKQYRMVNREKFLIARRKWEIKNKEKMGEYRRKYRILNLDRCRLLERQSTDRNRSRVNERNRLYQQKLRATPRGNLNHRMSVAIGGALRGQKRKASWKKLVPYSLEELKMSIENQFTDGMSWNEFLRGTIHIDHRIPKSKFRYSSPHEIEFKRCWAIENLQPKWAEDNLRKMTSIENPSQIPLGV